MTILMFFAATIIRQRLYNDEFTTTNDDLEKNIRGNRQNRAVHAEHLSVSDQMSRQVPSYRHYLVTPTAHSA